MAIRQGMSGLETRAPRAGAWTEIGSGRQLLALIAVLLVLNVALYFPGSLMNDSINQYAEATSGRFTDWHPPVMAWLWSKLRLVAQGPAPFFVLQLVTYWCGLGAIADAVRRMGHRRLALAVALAGAFPPFVFENAYVIKDVGMAVTLLAAVGIVFWFRSQGRRVPWPWGIAAAVLLAYGTLVRTNAVFALGPLLLYAMAPASWLRTLRLMVAAVAVALVGVPLSQVINDGLFHPVQRHAVDSLFMYDILGTAAQAHDPSIPGARAHVTEEDLRACYTPFWWDSFSSWGPCGKLVPRPDPDRAAYGEGLARQWVDTIRSHPVAWLEHRLKHFNSEVMFAVPLKHMRLAPEYRGDLPGFKPYETFTPSQVKLDLLRKNPTVWPVTWLVWGAVLVAFLARREPAPGVLFARVLAISALSYSGAYLIIGVATDLRYHYWSMLATVVATLVALPELRAGWRSGAPVLRIGLPLLGLVLAAGMAARLLDFQRWVF